jgi:hypothetical protein
MPDDDDEYAYGYDENGPIDHSDTEEYADGYEEIGRIDDRASVDDSEKDASSIGESTEDRSSGTTNDNDAKGVGSIDSKGRQVHQSELVGNVGGQGDSSDLDDEESAADTEQQVTEYLNGLQINATEPIKSRLSPSVQSLKEQVIAISPNVLKFRRVRKSIRI